MFEKYSDKQFNSNKLENVLNNLIVYRVDIDIRKNYILFLTECYLQIASICSNQNYKHAEYINLFFWEKLYINLMSSL